MKWFVFTIVLFPQLILANSRIPRLPGYCRESEGIFTTCEYDPRNILCLRNWHCPYGYKCCQYGCGGRTDCFRARPRFCFLEPDVGPCDGDELRYYFDTNSRRCRPFSYGGCEGNRNRFISRWRCERICGD